MKSSIGTAVNRLTIADAKRAKDKMSNNKTLFVLAEFIVMKLTVKPIAAKKANSWSMLPKSNNANNKNQKNGMPIICPIKIIKRYDTIEMTLNIFNCFTLRFFFVVADFPIWLGQNEATVKPC